jgi:hypothetical protein
MDTNRKALALGCLAMALMLCAGRAFGQSKDEWLTYPRPVPHLPGITSPVFVPQPQPPPPPMRVPNKVPETKWSEVVTGTIDDMKAGIEVVTKTIDGQETVIKYVVRRNPGGSIELHVAYWTLVAIQDREVEIRGPCGSACTLAVVAIPKDKLCFDADGYLGFHVATSLNKDGSASPDLKTTRGMVESYPQDIRAWINAKGGYKKMPIDGVWTLPAPDLWKMGYRKCGD